MVETDDKKKKNRKCLGRPGGLLSSGFPNEIIFSALLRAACQRRIQEFCSRGVQQIQLRTEDRDLGSGSPLVRGSGGGCNFVQEISSHIVKSS